MEASNVLLVTWPHPTTPEPLSLVWYLQSTAGDLTGFKILYQSEALSSCAAALAAAVGTEPIPADAPHWVPQSVQFLSPEKYQECVQDKVATFLAIWKRSNALTTKSVDDYTEACRLANKPAIFQRSSPAVQAAVHEISAGVSPAVVDPQSAVVLAEHLNQYIAAKVEEFKHSISDRSPAHSNYAEIEQWRRNLDESAKTVNALQQELKAVKSEEEEVLASTFQRISTLNEELIALQKGIRKKASPIRMSAGRCTAGRFLVLQCMNASSVIDARVTCLPQDAGVPLRVLLYREVHFIPFAIIDVEKAHTITLQDANGVFLTKHPLTLSEQFLQALPEVVLGQNFADLQKEQVVMTAAMDQFYLKFPGQRAKTTLNVYEQLGLRQDFSAEQVLANMEAELAKDRR